MALYLDTGCLLKLLFPEPESARTAEIVAAESRVIVSSLARLEAIVRIQGRHVGGQITAFEASRLVQALNRLAAAHPFETLSCPATLFQDAERQVSPGTSTTYCRTLDRLHVTAATAFGVKRLLTNDDAQAQAARAAGLRVLMPR